MPIITSQCGTTTPSIEQARQVLEGAGREVIVFAATATGGRTLESLIETVPVIGVRDVPTNERAEQLNLSSSPVTVLLPLGSGSISSAPVGPFHDASVDAGLYAPPKAALPSDMLLVELDSAVNDPTFAETCSRRCSSTWGGTTAPGRSPGKFNAVNDRGLVVQVSKPGTRRHAGSQFLPVCDL